MFELHCYYDVGGCDFFLKNFKRYRDAVSYFNKNFSRDVFAQIIHSVGYTYISSKLPGKKNFIRYGR